MLHWKDEFNDYICLEHRVVNPESGIPEIVVPFDIEVLHRNKGQPPTKLSIYHLDMLYRKCTKVTEDIYEVAPTSQGEYMVLEKDVQTGEYIFDCRTGKLELMCFYHGDFTVDGFHFTRDRRKSGDFSGKLRKVHSLVGKLREQVQKFTFTTPELDWKKKRYDGFLEALRKI